MREKRRGADRPTICPRLWFHQLFAEPLGGTDYRPFLVPFRDHTSPACVALATACWYRRFAHLGRIITKSQRVALGRDGHRSRLPVEAKAKHDTREVCAMAHGGKREELSRSFWPGGVASWTSSVLGRHEIPHVTQQRTATFSGACSYPRQRHAAGCRNDIVREEPDGMWLVALLWLRPRRRPGLLEGLVSTPLGVSSDCETKRCDGVRLRQALPHGCGLDAIASRPGVAKRPRAVRIPCHVV